MIPNISKKYKHISIPSLKDKRWDREGITKRLIILPDVISFSPFDSTWISGIKKFLSHNHKYVIDKNKTVQIHI
jgi:hypothetical protein